VLNRWTRLTAILLASSFSTGCIQHLQVGSPVGPAIKVGSDQPAVTNIEPSACVWEKQFLPDPPREHLTTREALFLTEHNDHVHDNCPQAPIDRPKAP